MWFGLDFANKIRTQDVGETEGVTQGSRVSAAAKTGVRAQPHISSRAFRGTCTASVFRM